MQSTEKKKKRTEHEYRCAQRQGRINLSQQSVHCFGAASTFSHCKKLTIFLVIVVISLF